MLSVTVNGVRHAVSFENSAEGYIFGCIYGKFFIFFFSEHITKEKTNHSQVQRVVRIVVLVESVLKVELSQVYNNII